MALDRARRDLANTVLRAPIAGVATQVSSIQMGRYLTAGTAVFSIISSDSLWIDANPKETDLTYVRPRPAGRPSPSMPFPTGTWTGTVAAISPGTGAQFAILPPQNAAGNWIKIVQRVPMRVEFAPGQDLRRLRAGMSATVEIDTGRRGRLARFLGASAVAAGPRSMIAARRTALRPSTPSARRRLLITICVMMATIMQVLDITIANVSLPYMQGSLSATLDQVSWVLTSYVVAAAVMTAPVGWLAARFGIKKLLITCVVGFTVASMLCGIAQSIEEIVVFRVVQGMFGAALVPLSQTVMLEIYPPEQRGWAMSLWGMGVMIGPIMGPILGGWLTEYYTWRWIFFINLPFGIATALGPAGVHGRDRGQRPPALRLVRLCSPQHRHRRAAADARPRRAAGLVRFQRDRGDGAGVGGRPSTSSSRTRSPRAQPFIALEIFRDRNFVIGLMFMFVCGVLLVASMALMAPFLQGVMGYPIIDVGLLLGTRGIGMAIGHAGGGTADDARRPARAAGRRPRLLHRLALLLDRLLARHLGRAPSSGPASCRAIGLGLMFVPLNTLALSSLPPALRTQGTAMWTLIRNLGGSIGVSIVIANLTNKTIVMHARLAESVTPFNQALADPAAAMLDPGTEMGRALLEQLMSQQAAIMAYANDFKLMMVMTLLAFPLILLIRVRDLGLRPGA